MEQVSDSNTVVNVLTYALAAESDFYAGEFDTGADRQMKSL